MDFAISSQRILLRPADCCGLLNLSQQAPAFFRNSPSRSCQFPRSLFNKPETPELWTNHEKLLLACLTTGDDKSALECLERITSRFGPANERVMGLRGLYEEALAQNEIALEKILKGYNTVLKENPVNVPILKRRIALLRSMSRPLDAISMLVEFLDAFPTDAEAWCELADLYQGQGLCSQAAFCLEEALLVFPNAWNLHAKLGEILYISAAGSPDVSETSLRALAESIKRFCRSMELCDNYIRGYCGLYMSSTRFLNMADLKGGCRWSDDLPSQDMVRKLQKISATKLRDIQVPLQYGISVDNGQNTLVAAKLLSNDS